MSEAGKVVWSEDFLVAPQSVRDEVRASSAVTDALVDYFAREKAGTATTLTVDEALDLLSDL